MKPRKPLNPKKVSKQAEVKRLSNLAERLWKEHAHMRDGEGCQVAILFPEIPCPHNSVFQIDHCVKRGLKATFYDPRNSTKVCGKCNWAKFRDLWGVKRAIDQIVEKREGPEAWADLKRIEQQKPLVRFKEVWWLEEQINRLQLSISALNESRGVNLAAEAVLREDDHKNETAA